MVMKKLKAKHDAVLAPVPADDMPPNYYLESNRPYAEQAGQLFAERTARMMRDSLGEEPSENAMQMYAKSGFDHFMDSWHQSGRDIDQEVRSDVIHIGGHNDKDVIDERIQQYPDQLRTRFTNDMFGGCERDMFKDNVGRQVDVLKNMSVPMRAAAVSELYGKNGQSVNPMILQTIWNNESRARSAEFAQPSVSGRRLPDVGEELLNQPQSSMSDDYGDYGG